MNYIMTYIVTKKWVSKFLLDSHIGAQALIKDIRIHDGSNNALLEEIVGYNIATMLKYDYHKYLQQNCH